jgi:hypothetical protein
MVYALKTDNFKLKYVEAVIEGESLLETHCH